MFFRGSNAIAWVSLPLVGFASGWMANPGGGGDAADHARAEMNLFMKMRLLVGVVMIGFVVPSGAAELDAGVLEELSAAMAKQVEEAWVSGVIGLIAKDGEVGYYETFGKRVIEGEVAMGKDTLMRIFSMTKPIVAVTAMALWEEGKFKLDDPISKFCRSGRTRRCGRGPRWWRRKAR